MENFWTMLIQKMWIMWKSIISPLFMGIFLWKTLLISMFISFFRFFLHIFLNINFVEKCRILELILVFNICLLLWFFRGEKGWLFLGFMPLFMEKVLNFCFGRIIVITFNFVKFANNWKYTLFLDSHDLKYS